MEVVKEAMIRSIKIQSGNMKMTCLVRLHFL